VRFENTGPEQIPGLIVMSITDERFALIGRDTDAVVLFNGSDEEQRFTTDTFKDISLELHPVLKESADTVVKAASYDKASGTFTVPARTTAVFMGKRAPFVPPGNGPGAGDTSCGCSGAGGAAFSAFALLLGLGVLRRTRRREQ
jgi:MYXO-CTERM domain-containing protein